MHSNIVYKTADTVILGAGLSGLAAAFKLSTEGARVICLERSLTAGGLARTINHNGFRFDLGGHRFKTDNKAIECFVRQILNNDIRTVKRASKILLRGKYINYPLKPLNAIFSLGIVTASKILLDYTIERLRPHKETAHLNSLQDWVIHNFGKTLYDIYFKEYSEKVWGLNGSEIDMLWIKQRIQGLSLGAAIKNALLPKINSNFQTLTSHFLYPTLGIGQIVERLEEKIKNSNGKVTTKTQIKKIMHQNNRVTGVLAKTDNSVVRFKSNNFISSIPLPALVQLFSPKPPQTVLDAAASLRYRDLIIVAIMIDRARVTDQTWIYLPEDNIPFARIHEPTNWSSSMAPEGQTLLVAEHFCFAGDSTWNADDQKIVKNTVTSLLSLGFIKRHEVIDSYVLRVPKAYPLFEIGYSTRTQIISNYLQQFTNLIPIGRSGLFRYYNMDDAIASGLEAASEILSQNQKINHTEESSSMATGIG